MHRMAVTLLTMSIATLTGGAPLHAQRARNSVLTAEDIERAKGSINTAYDAVQTLRPRWLQVHEISRIPSKSTEPFQTTPIRVYLNDVNVGRVDYLMTIPAATVLEMRWLSANETASRYGPTDGQAAIVVTLKR